MYGQTLQNPTYGNTTTNTLKIKTPATVTSVNFLTAFGVDGISVAKIDPVNLPISTATQTALNGKQSSLTNPVTGTGISGQVSFWNGTTFQTGDSSLFWDNTNKRLGIGTNSLNWDFTISKGSANTALFVNTLASGSSGGAIITLQSDDNAAIATNDRLGAYVFGGRYSTGAGNIQNSVGGLYAFSSTNWTSTSNSAADMHIMTRQSGTNRSVGIFGADGVFYLGTSTGNSSNDPAMIIKRNLTGSPGLNGHAYVDEGTVNRDGVIGYNSFDCKTEMQGSFNYDHFAGFQSRPRYVSSGNINRLIGYQSLPHTSTTGVINNIFGYDVYDPTGTGTVINNYGLHVRPLTRGTNNYAIYTNSGKVYLGDNVEVNGKIKASPATASDEVIVKSQLDSAARPYKVYTALLSQTGTSAPVATVLENTLGGTVVWTRNSVGNYSATLTGAFTFNKSWGNITLSTNVVSYSATITNTNDDTMNLLTMNGSNVVADISSTSASIEFRVYQ